MGRKFALFLIILWTAAVLGFATASIVKTRLALSLAHPYITINNNPAEDSTDTDILKAYLHYNQEATIAAEEAMAGITAIDPDIESAFIMINARTMKLEVATASDPALLTNPRPAGSALLPFIYAAGFSAGSSPCDVIIDEPQPYTIDNETFYTKNFNDVYLGPLPMRSGLYNSLISAGAYVANKAGNDIQNMESAFGFDNNSISPLNLAMAYATLANYGETIPLTPRAPAIDEHTDKQIGESTKFTAAASYQTMYIMQDIANTGDADGSGLLPGTAAILGQTENDHDIWAVAISYPYVILAWQGYLNDNLADKTVSSTYSRNSAMKVVGAFQQTYFGDRQFKIPVPNSIVFKNVSINSCEETGNINDSYIEAFAD